MKKRCLLILMLFVMAYGYTQVPPILKSAGKEIGLSSLEIKVDVVGNIATTTYNMLFHNPTNQVLEGELSFPLGEGHNVSRFALDVNGKLREAVVVDKELGRIAFEQVVRRGVDPALLEKGTGNNYKARIYPIPANGYKRVVLAYEQELILNDGDQFYNLPLSFKNKLDVFKLEILVFNQESKPVIEKGQISDLDFSSWKKNYRTSVLKKNYIPNKNLLIKIPVPINTEKILTSDNYFYLYKAISPEKRLRKKPSKISIFWDASMSMEERNLEKELSLLEEYFGYLKNVNVCFVSFSNTILSDKEFKIVEGNWDALKKEISETIYDGGTAYDILIDKNNDADVKLLFSDGIVSLSNINLNKEKPVFIINSLTKSNHSALNHLAESSNGAYINLNTKSNSEGLSNLKFESYKFLGYRAESKSLEVYPKGPVSISNDFSISGKNIKNGDKILLDFGYGNETLKTVSITVNTSDVSLSDIRRIWAQKKLDDLEVLSRENKAQITKLGINYSLVTDYTSLIVLEDVRDYIRYKITPPEELLEEYNQALTLIEDEKKKNKKLLNYSEALTTPESPQLLNLAGVEMELEEIVISEDNIAEESAHGYARFGIVANDEEIVETSEIEILEVDENHVPFSVIEIAPTFPGCEGSNQEKKQCFSSKISTHITNHFNLELASNLDLPTGRQRINTLFTINSKGNITNIRVRAPHNKLEREVKRIINLLPQMIPGKQRGKNVDVIYSLPIVFRVDDGQIVDLQHGVESPKYKKYSGQLVVNDRLVDTDYINALKEIKNKNKAYQLYLKQRKDYLKTPAYYIDVSNYFKETFNDHIYSFRILSNIAEADFDNYELLKSFGYQLQANNQDHLALFIFKKILDLRTEDAQSYRDLALAFQNVGKCQKALDLYNSIITGAIYKNNERRIFEGIALIARNEIKYLIQNYRDDLDLSKIDKKLLDEIHFDVRITVDWNHNDTDIDLHVIDPNLEECFYNHSKTKIGGKMSPDMTQGFGPEEFILSNAIKGDYFIKVKYYGDRYQKEENPTFMKVTMYKNYGFEKESKEIKIIRLTKSDDEEIIAKLSF